MEINTYISIDEILHDVLKAVDDEDLKKGFERGWFMSQIQQAIEEIGFDSFYKVVTVDLPFDSNKLSVDLPPNAFNLREIYLFSNGYYVRFTKVSDGVDPTYPKLIAGNWPEPPRFSRRLVCLSHAAMA